MKVFNKADAMPPALLAGTVALLVFFTAGTWWLLQPEYAALYKDASESGRAEVTRLLAQQNIPYRLGKDGAIEINKDNLDTARSSLVEAGLPSEHGKGYELFDNSDYGMSEFAQKINYQRALEGELARSLMSLREIRTARVHLTLKKNSLYRSQQDGSKASVVLQLRQDMSLDRKQISGIQQMVASSVEGLNPEAVVVIDESGMPLNGQQAYDAFDERWQISSRIEGDLQNKAQDVLNRAYGAQNAKASVRVQMNFDRVRSVKELPVSVDGSGNGIVVKEKQHQSFDANKGAVSTETGGREQHSDETEYAIGKSHSEIDYSPGKIERVSVGVVLSDSLAGIDAKALHDVLSATLGLNEERGDRLSIAYMPMLAVAPSSALSADTMTPPSPAADHHIERLPSWIWGVLAGLLLITAALSILLLRMRHPALSEEPTLSAEEREKLLQDVRQWLKQPVQGELP